MCKCFSKRKANANCLINPTIVKRLIGIRRLLLVLSKKRRQERQALKCQIKTINEEIIEEFRKYNCNIIKSRLESLSNNKKFNTNKFWKLKKKNRPLCHSPCFYTPISCFS